jgi:alpha-mannosidase
MATPVQRLADGRLALIAGVPGLGLSTVRFERRAADPIQGCSIKRDGDRIVLEQPMTRVEIDERGHLVSLVERTVSMGGAPGEMLAAPANVLQLFEDHPNQYDAWDIDAVALRQPQVIDAVESIEIIDEGPLVVSVRVDRLFGSSTISQLISMRWHSPLVEITTDIDWQENEKLLKVAFPLAVRADEATYEIQFGSVSRPTHSNTSWDDAQFEVCAQKWADLSEPDRGVAIVNDSKYGYDCVDNVLRLTLLRAPNYPDPTCDRGRHQFSYGVVAHRDSAADARVAETAAAFNLPIRSRTGGASDRAAPDRRVEVRGRGVMIEAVKLADDGSGDRRQGPATA